MTKLKTNSTSIHSWILLPVVVTVGLVSCAAETSFESRTGLKASKVQKAGGDGTANAGDGTAAIIPPPPAPVIPPPVQNPPVDPEVFNQTNTTVTATPIIDRIFAGKHDVPPSTKVIHLGASLACANPGDPDPNIFKTGLDLNGLPAPTYNTHKNVGKDVDFFGETDVEMANGPDVVVGLWTSSAAPGMASEHMPRPDNFMSLGYLSGTLEVYGQLSTGTPFSTPPVPASTLFNGKAFTEVTPVGGGTVVSVERLIRRGISHLVEARSKSYSPKPLYVYAGVMACRKMADADSVSIPARDQVYRFFSEFVGSAMLTKIDESAKFLGLTAINAVYGASADGISLEIQRDVTSPSDSAFGSRVLMKLAGAVAASSNSTSLATKDITGTTVKAPTLLNSIKDHLVAKSSCSQLGDNLGADKDWWNTHAKWDAAGMGIGCYLLNGTGAGKTFGELVSGLETDYAANSKELIARLVRASIFASASASFPTAWLKAPRCFTDPGQYYVNTILNSHTIPLQRATAANGVAQINPMSYTTNPDTLAGPFKNKVTTGIWSIADSSILHPEPGFAIGTYSSYLTKRAAAGGAQEPDYLPGNLKVVFGMSDTGAPTSGLSAATNTAGVALEILPGANPTVSADQFLSKDLYIKLLLRRVKPCSVSGRVYCRNDSPVGNSSVRGI